MLFLTEIVGDAMGNDTAKTFHLYQFLFRGLFDFFQIKAKIAAKEFCISQTYVVDTQSIDKVWQFYILGLFNRRNQVIVRFFTKAFHMDNFVFMLCKLIKNTHRLNGSKCIYINFLELFGKLTVELT